jgi:vacuolar-type H+-ATPase subunit E/Vma4
MALADLLRAIEAEADLERAQAERAAEAEASAILARAREEAHALELALSAAQEAQARTEAALILALAERDAASAIRSAREAAFVSLLDGIRETFAALRASEAYPSLFAALLAESRAALPVAGVVRIDRRDADLVWPLAGGLGVELTLESWGGLELATDDGRTLRNTLEERLANAEPILRRRFTELLPRAG